MRNLGDFSLKEKKHIKIEQDLECFKKKQLMEALNHIPRNTTVAELRIAYINHVMKLSGENRTYAANELGLNYTTIMGMIRRGDITYESRNKGRPSNSSINKK